MSINNLISLSSAIVATAAAITAYLSLSEQRRISAICTNFAILHETESKMSDNPELLQLHGISSEMLNECNVNTKELIYILNSFNAAQAYYRLYVNNKISKSSMPIILSSYRKNLLTNEKVRRVWMRIIKKRMLEESPFTLAVDKFIDENFNS